MDQERGIDEDHTTILDRANPIFYSAAVALVFFTLLTLSWPLVTLWSCAAAIIGAYLFFRNRSLVPNLMIHLKPVTYQESENDKQSIGSCQICGNTNCNRHTELINTELIMPWEGLDIPVTIDESIAEFLEIILKRFVSSWHSELTEKQVFTNELRYLIRHGLCVVLRRAAKIDIPRVVTGPLLQTIAEHMHAYLTVKNQLPLSATPTEIRQQMWCVLGSKIHIGLRGQTGNLRYFQNVTRTALSLLLPPGKANSRVLNLFLEELFTTKVMIPTMDYVSTPDFINKILILIFDKESKLVHMHGPQSRLVPILENFSKQRDRDKLQISINQIMKSQKLLYPFMQYLKSNGGIHILQFYLSCNELRKNMAAKENDSLTQEYVYLSIDQIKRLYGLYMNKYAENFIYFESSLVFQIEQILSSECSDDLKLLQLLEYKILDKACHHVLLVLEKSFCRSFYHSKEYHEAMMRTLTLNTRRNINFADPHSISRHFEKWRRQRKRVFSHLQETPLDTPRLQYQNSSNNIPTSSLMRQRSSSSSSTSSLSSSPIVNTLEESVMIPAPSHVQVVDSQTISSSIKPFTVYTIVTHIKDADDKSVITVQRRYKEFSVLDTRIHQFYRNVPAHLPPKKTFQNMDKIFIESRQNELERYLQKLIEQPEVRNSQLLRSFLAETMDTGLFMPDTVGDKAGKIIKSVPHILKKEPRGQHLENLIQAMETSVATTPRKPSAKKKLQTQEWESRNQSIIEEYEETLKNDLTSSEKNIKLYNSQIQTGDPVHLNGIMDFLVYMAIHVYKVSRTQLASLLVVKILGQNSIEALVQDMLSNRVELICMENKACQLIQLLQYNLFFDESPPRTPQDKAKRREEAVHTILTRPPDILINMIGRERFHQNTKLLIEGVQDSELNKQLLFSMLDVVLWELFPELRT